MIEQMKKEVVIIYILILFIFLINPINSSHEITFSDGQDSHTVYTGKSYLYNITITNSDVGQDANISQVNITLPENFTFTIMSQGTDAYDDYSKDGNVLSWTNSSYYLINGSEWKNFWFNATVSSPGIYNITITTVNFSDVIQTNLSVTVNLCTATWYCDNWNECMNGTQTRNCVDVNNCGSEINKPYENKTCEEVCNPNWQCTNWSECLNNIQIKTCIDKNVCGNDSTKPIENQSCGKICEPNWQCDEWQPEECSAKQIRSRNCTDLNNCNTLSEKPVETKTCKYKVSFEWLFFVIVGIISSSIITVIVLILNLLRKRKI